MLNRGGEYVIYGGQSWVMIYEFTVVARPEIVPDDMVSKQGFPKACRKAYLKVACFGAFAGATVCLLDTN